MILIISHNILQPIQKIQAIQKLFLPNSSKFFYQNMVQYLYRYFYFYLFVHIKTGIQQQFNSMYNLQYSQTQNFPYTQANDYSSQQSIIEAFPHLKHLNTNRQWNGRKNIDGVIIRSANDDNVHKAIKYGIWATTSKNRTKLSQLFTRARIENKEVYLFFSVVKSGMFQGVAKLTSGLVEENFPYWWDDFNMKFKGFFKIQWVYLKDVNFKHLEGLYNLDNQQVTKSKDCDLLDCPTTIKMLNVFQNKPIKQKWIFNDFSYMDKRQKQYTRRLQQHNSSPYQFSAEYQNYNFMSGMGNMTEYGNLGMAVSMNQNSPYLNYSQQMMPFPPQMMKPSNQQGFSHEKLGFQMNPVSYKQKKK